MSPTSLTNFNVPLDMRLRFDAICQASGRTRTSVLIEMMENYILSRGQEIVARAEEFRKVDQLIESRPLKRFKDFCANDAVHQDIGRQSRSNQEFEPPAPFMSDGQGDW